MARRITTDPAAPDAVAHIVANMREADAEEFAAAHADDPQGVIDATVNAPVSMTVSVDGVPVAALGGYFEEPDTWRLFMFATDEFLKCSLFTTKYVVRQLLPLARRLGGNRACCWSMAGHDVAHSWLESLGAVAVGEAPLGRAGEKFILFEWLLPDVHPETA